MAFELVKTTIKVEGSPDEIIFSDLVINQYLADVNSFSFTWRQEEGHSSLADHVKFYQDYLSKVVTINIRDDFSFKGMIYAINCNNQDSLGVSYDIVGKGMFVKLDEVPVCRSMYKMTLSDMFNKVNGPHGTRLKLQPENKSVLFYTVQYNQTDFEFLRMMAARYGEWLYYNGNEMVLGPPSGSAEKLTYNEDVFNLDISAKMVRATENNVGFDQYKGQKLNGKQAAAAAQGFIDACLSAGRTAYGNAQSFTHVSNAATEGVLKEIATLKHKAAAASSVTVSGSSYNSKLKLAGKMKLADEMGENAGEYVITEIHHRCQTNENYQNNFLAVPADIQVPPYTNPQLFAVCKAQPALVVNNEDTDGLDRIKVQFPWQEQSSTTPWLSVLTPHAGKDKGIRFLPEIDEEVLVGFVDNNAEKPFIMGAVHTEKNKSGTAPSKNNQKTIGTKTGRRLEIDDDTGALALADNYAKKTPKNIVYMRRKDSTVEMKVNSHKDDDNYSNIHLKNEESLEITVTNGGSPVTQIKLEKSGKKITIMSKGSIDINASGDLNLSASNITLSASQELKMEGKAKGVSLKGMKMELKADTTMDIKGATSAIEGSAKMDVKGGAMVTIGAAIVKIN